MKTLTLILAVTSLSLVACSKKKEDAKTSANSGESQQVEFKPSESMADSLRMIETSKLGCADPDECPEQVGHVLSASEDGVSMCTGTLISENQVMTNSHCILKEFQGKNRKVNGQMFVRFYKTGKAPAELLKVEEVEFATEIDVKNKDLPENMDYAVLKLVQPTTRKRITPSFDGITDQLKLKVFAIDPIHHPFLIEGKLVRKNCVSVMNSIFNATYDNPNAMKITLSGCDIIKGNSGSLLIGENNKAYGIVSAYIVEETLDLLLDMARPESNLFVIPKLSFGWNMACVPELNSRVPNECEESRPVPDKPGQSAFDKIDMESAGKDFQKQLLEWANVNKVYEESVVLDYTDLDETKFAELESRLGDSCNRRSKLERSYIVIPHCVRKNSILDLKLKRSDSVSGEVKMMIHTLGFETDQYGRLTYKLLKNKLSAFEAVSTFSNSEEYGTFIFALKTKIGAVELDARIIKYCE